MALDKFLAKESVPLLDEVRNSGVSIGGMDFGRKGVREGGRTFLLFRELCQRMSF